MPFGFNPNRNKKINKSQLPTKKLVNPARKRCVNINNCSSIQPCELRPITHPTEVLLSTLLCCEPSLQSGRSNGGRVLVPLASRGSRERLGAESEAEQWATPRLAAGLLPHCWVIASTETIPHTPRDSPFSGWLRCNEKAAAAAAAAVVIVAIAMAHYHQSPSNASACVCLLRWLRSRALVERVTADISSSQTQTDTEEQPRRAGYRSEKWDL